MQTSNYLEILSFKMGDAKFGLDIDQIREIIKMVKISHLPDGPDSVEGVINLRGKIVPVVDLRTICEVEVGKEDIIHLHIIIVQIEKTIIGMIVDKANEVLKIEPGSIEPPCEGIPLIQFLSGVAKLENELMFILDLNKIFTFQQKSILKKVNRKKIEAQLKEEIEILPMVKSILHQRAISLSKAEGLRKEIRGEAQLLSFSLGKEWYGLRAKSIREILRPPKITKLPFTPECLLGIINLRGEIVAVVDIKKILDLPQEEKDFLKGPRIIVIEAQKKTVGLWVDKVEEMVDFLPSAIGPPLSTLDKTRASFIEGEVEIEEKNRVVTLLNLENIIDYKMEP